VNPRIVINSAFCCMGVFDAAVNHAIEEAGNEAVTGWAANSNAAALAAYERLQENLDITVERRECADLLHYNHRGLPESDLLIGGFSCPGFSQAGQPGRASSQDVRDHHAQLRMTPHACHDLVDGCRPRRALFENVPDLERWPAYRWWLDGFRVRGYEVATIKLRDDRCGGYTVRERLFICIYNDGVDVGSPPPIDTLPRPWPEVIDWDEGRWKPYDEAPAGPKRRLDRALMRGLGGHRIFIQNVTDHAGKRETDRLPTLTTGDQFGLWKAPASRAYRHLDERGEYSYRVWTAKEQARITLGPHADKLPKMRKDDLTTFLGNAVPWYMGLAAARWAFPQETGSQP